MCRDVMWCVYVSQYASVYVAVAVVFIFFFLLLLLPLPRLFLLFLLVEHILRIHLHTHYIIQLWLGLISSPSPFVLFCFFSISFFPLLITHIYLNRIRTGVCGCVLLLLNACACTMFMCCCPVWRFFSLFFSVCSFSLFYYSVDVCLCVSKKSMYPHINSYYTHFMTSFYVFSAVVVAFFLSARCLFHLLCFDLC